MKSPEEIADVLKEKNIKADYIFFFSYIILKKNGKQTPWVDKDLVDVNGQSAPVSPTVVFT